MSWLKWLKDARLIFGFILAHLLLYFTFNEKDVVFWYIFAASMLFLISYSIFNEEAEKKMSFFSYLIYGVISGVFLYGLFWMGNFLIDAFNLSTLAKEVSSLYRKLSPETIWQYFFMLAIIIPGEEIFWRGFIQKRLKKTTSIVASIIISAVMYASVQFYSGTMILPFAALVSGLFWGLLYTWKRSIQLVIVSHLVFNLLLLVILPLN